MMPKEDGYYWAIINNIWQIVEIFNGIIWVIGDNEPYKSEDIRDWGPRIIMEYGRITYEKE